MIPIQSTIEGREVEFATMQQYLQSYQFNLGGNWDYDHGCFDRHLDEQARKVWLRIPFHVTRGHIDSEKENTEAMIKIGKPYVLKHIYNEGLDAEAVPRVYTSVFDQFQDPLDKDAEVEQQWLNAAGEILRAVERGLAN